MEYFENRTVGLVCTIIVGGLAGWIAEKSLKVDMG